MIATSSYLHGASATPLLGKTIGGLFDDIVDAFPDNTALVVHHQKLRWTYKELGTKVDAFAAGLVALGLQPGERVGILAPNCAEWVVTQFATAKAGLILVNINPAYRINELENALSSVGCKALISADSYRSSDYIGMIRDIVPEIAGAPRGKINAKQLPDLRFLIAIGASPQDAFYGFEEIYELGRDAHRQRVSALSEELQFDDPINIQFTSGTTGLPKAATLTHHNIVNNAYFTGLRMNLDHRDRLCIPVPMYHCFGMVLGTLCAVSHGAAIVFPEAGFDAHAVLETIASERCTILHGVPTMFFAELDESDFASHDLSSLRTGIMAGAPCPVELMNRVINDMGANEITIAYGMTETGPVSFMTSRDDTLERRVETVGSVLPHVEIKIVDDQGRIVPRGEVGELKTRGYLVMPYYWENPEKTAATIDSARWIASGDLASIDDAGYCRIVGRLKDMLIRGGENIYPTEIEEFLYTSPKIDQVQVVGVPDPKYGEEICAWIKLKEGENATEEEIRSLCKGKIAHFKIPRYIRFVDSFPMTVTGKVQKYIIRERMAAELEKDRVA